MDDRALLPVTRATLPDYCDDLTVREIAGADHWVVHQRTEEVVALIRGFIGNWSSRPGRQPESWTQPNGTGLLDTGDKPSIPPA
jgi:hypothetical protein